MPSMVPKDETKLYIEPAACSEDEEAATAAAVMAAGGKSLTPTEVGKSVIGQHEEGHTSQSESDTDKENSSNYLGKVPRTGGQHKKMKRSLGSGFELVDLQLGIAVDPANGPGTGPGSSGRSSGGGRSPGASIGSPGASTASTGDELPPEDEWRDGVIGGCFGGGFATIGLTSLCCTSAALFQVMEGLGWSQQSCRRTLTLMAVAMLWLSVPLTLYLGLWPLAVAAAALVLSLEAFAAFRLRQVVRRRFDIEGSACQDCLVSTLLTPCATAQMLRHLHVSP